MVGRIFKDGKHPAQITFNGRIVKKIFKDNRRVWWYPARTDYRDPDYIIQLPSGTTYDWDKGYYIYHGKQISDVGVKANRLYFDNTTGKTHKAIINMTPDHAVIDETTLDRLPDGAYLLEDLDGTGIVGWGKAHTDSVSLFRVNGSNRNLHFIISGENFFRYGYHDHTEFFMAVFEIGGANNNIKVTVLPGAKMKIQYQNEANLKNAPWLPLNPPNHNPNQLVNYHEVFWRVNNDNSRLWYWGAEYFNHQERQINHNNRLTVEYL